MLRGVGQLGRLAARLIVAGFRLLPAGRVATVLEDLMDVEIEDPSGKAELNRAGLTVGLIMAMVLLGMVLIGTVGRLVADTSMPGWTIPMLFVTVFASMLHSLICANILSD